MIVLFVLGIVLLAYAAIKGVTRHEVRWPALVVGLILTVLMGLGLQRAQERHFLMAKVPVEKTQKIAPALTINGIKLITTQKASDGELRYTYTLGKKSYQTVTQNAKTIVKTADKQATLKTEVMTYQATSGWRRFMLLGQETFEKGANVYVVSAEGLVLCDDEPSQDFAKHGQGLKGGYRQGSSRRSQATICG